MTQEFGDDTNPGRPKREPRELPLPPVGDEAGPGKRQWTRRRALGVIGGGGAVGLGLLAGRDILFDPASSKKPRDGGPREQAADEVTTSETPPTEPPPPAAALWSDPATWGGTVPGAGDIAVIDKAVKLDVDTQVAGVQIRPTGQLIYDPDVGHTLSTTGNVIVEGALRMRPANAAINHVLAFADIDEGRYAGDHTMVPVDTDVGVWVVGTGVLDMFGTAKKAWTNLSGEAASGAASITVDDASGWQVGDEIVVTPTESSSSTDDDAWEHHDRRIVTAVAGNQVTLDQALEHNHPAVTVKPGMTMRAEVLNLSRNVRVEGAPDARSHIIILHNQAVQTMGWFGLRHMGPRPGDEGVLGRYALHFHMCDNGVHGSTVEGGVVYDSGNHAFVSHLTNGVTFRDCVVHDNIDDAYWWDLAPDTAQPDEVPSDDVVYDRCVASYIKLGDNPHAVAGFQITAGANNVAKGCVASGIDGLAVSSAGFIWQKHSSSRDSWIFEDNVVHNSKYGGIYYWQNNTGRTIVDRFTVYNSGYGIFAGSYVNAVSYRDCTVYACYIWGLKISAVAMLDDELGQGTTYEGIYVDQTGLTDFAVDVINPSVVNDRVTPIINSTFKGGSKAQIGFDGGDQRFPQLYEFRDCVFDGNAFWLNDNVRGDTQLHVVDNVNGSILVQGKSSGGPGRSEWNASVTSA